MGIEDEIEKIEKFERAWKTLPDELIEAALHGRLAPLAWTQDQVDNLIRHVVARCFDLHVSQMAEFSTPEEDR